MFFKVATMTLSIMLLNQIPQSDANLLTNFLKKFDFTEGVMSRLWKLNPLVIHTEPNDVKYYISLHNGTVERLHRKSLSLLDPTNETVCIIHGYMSNIEVPWVQELAQIYHSSGNHNVVLIDWTSHSKRNYVQAVRAVEPIAHRISRFLRNLSEMYDLNRVHLVGHSLGAHLAGIVGKVLHKHQLQLGRITGLDPAAPLFESFHVIGFKRLEKTDARQVLVVHTNCEFFGICNSHGDVDVFVNDGGPYQPGCKHDNIMPKMTCGHESSHVYFRRALRKPRDYTAIKCLGSRSGMKQCYLNDVISLGGDIPEGRAGNYFLFIQDSLAEFDGSNYTYNDNFLSELLGMMG